MHIDQAREQRRLSEIDIRRPRAGRFYRSDRGASENHRRIREQLSRSIEHTCSTDAQLALLRLNVGAEKNDERGKYVSHSWTRAVTSI